MGKYLDGSGLSYLAGLIKSALGLKQDALVSGTNIKTINNESLLGSGNISVSGGSIPSGGMQGAVLAKASATDGDVTWAESAAPFKVYASSTNTNQAFCGFRSLVASDLPDLSGTYLPLTGGTLTGELVIEDSELDRGTTPSANQYHRLIELVDVNGDTVGYLQANHATDGSVSFTLGSDNSDGTAQNQIILGYGVGDGPFVVISHPAQWRSALSVPSTSQVWNSTTSRTANTVLAAPNGSNGVGSFRSLVLADFPSAVQNKLNSIVSNNSEIILQSLNGLTRLYLTYNSTNNTHNLRVDTRASTSDAWTTLYYPATQPITETTIANIITQTSAQSSANPISSATYYKHGAAAMLEIAFKPAAARAAGTAFDLGTVVSGKRPHLWASGGSQTIMARMTTGGAIQLVPRGALTAGTTYAIGFTYLL